MWKYVGGEKGMYEGGILGIGGGEFEDKDFEALVEEYEKREGPHAKGSVKKSGLYEHVPDKAAAKEGKD